MSPLLITFILLSLTSTLSHPSQFSANVTSLPFPSQNLSLNESRAFPLNSFFNGFNVSYNVFYSEALEVEIIQNNFSSTFNNLINLTNYQKHDDHTMIGFDYYSGYLFLGVLNEHGYPVFNLSLNISNKSSVTCRDLVKLSNDGSYLLDCYDSQLNASCFYDIKLGPDSIRKILVPTQSSFTDLYSRYIKVLHSGNQTYILRSQYGLNFGTIGYGDCFCNNSQIEVFSYNSPGNITSFGVIDHTLFNAFRPLRLIDVVVDGSEVFLLDNYTTVRVASILNGRIQVYDTFNAWYFYVPFLRVLVDSSQNRTQNGRLVVLSGPYSIEFWNLTDKSLTESYIVSECDDIIRGFDFNEDFILLQTGYWNQKTWKFYNFMFVYSRGNSKNINSYVVDDDSLFFFDRKQSVAISFQSERMYSRLVTEKEPRAVVRAVKSGVTSSQFWALSAYMGGYQQASLTLNATVTDEKLEITQIVNAFLEKKN